jgi:hypothetical protein
MLFLFSVVLVLDNIYGGVVSKVTQASNSQSKRLAKSFCCC